MRVDIRDQRGFTLIELLIVIVVIGILVALALPQFAMVKEKSFDAEAKTDLRNMLTVENAYFADWQAFTNVSVPQSGQVDLDGDGQWDYRASAGVTVVATAYTDGMQVTAAHFNSPNTWCVNSSATQSAGNQGAIQNATSC